MLSGMADGNVIRLVEGVLAPVSTVLDTLFYAGALYGVKVIAQHTWNCVRGLRTYFLPFGRMSNGDMTKTLGKWALIAGGTSGIGMAFAHEVII